MPESEGRLQRILTWLRRGYQDGIPGQDYIPLLEVLHRRLTDAEVDAIVGALIEEEPEPVSRDAVIDAMQRRILERPSEADIARVVRTLEGAGWAVDLDQPEGPPGDRYALREDF